MLTLPKIRQAGAKIGLFTIAKIAKHFGVSRWAVYASIKEPERVPELRVRLLNFVNGID